MLSARKRKANTMHPATKGKHKRTLGKSRPTRKIFCMPPQERPRRGETSHEAPMGQENVEEEEDIFERVARMTLADLANIVEEFDENQEFLQQNQEQEQEFVQP